MDGVCWQGTAFILLSCAGKLQYTLHASVQFGKIGSLNMLKVCLSGPHTSGNSYES